MPLLEVRNLTVGKYAVHDKFRENLLKAIDNIGFSIEEGEIAGIAGESGCGKSMTALSIINLLPAEMRIAGGEIIFNNQSLLKMTERELCAIRGRDIGIIFQDTRQSLNPMMRAGDQITEMLELQKTGIVEQGKRNRENETGKLRQKTKTREQRLESIKRKIKNKEQVLEILKSIGFNHPEKVFDAFPHQLSGGMCQRVVTAMAAICRPKLLLADEPSSSLDEDSYKRVLSLLLEMNQKYKTSLLIISHDLSIIKQFCSRYLIMYAGKIIEEGPASSLYSPLHPYTQALLEALPAKEKRGKHLENIPGKVPAIEDNFPGCPFAPRCKKAQKICRESFPPLTFHDKNKNIISEIIPEKINGKAHCYFPETGVQTNE